LSTLSSGFRSVSASDEAEVMGSIGRASGLGGEESAVSTPFGDVGMANE
jgi:hypothetical protein